MTTRRAVAIWILFVAIGACVGLATIIRDPSWHIWQIVGGLLAGGVAILWTGFDDDLREWLSR